MVQLPCCSCLDWRWSAQHKISPSLSVVRLSWLFLGAEENNYPNAVLSVSVTKNPATDIGQTKAELATGLLFPCASPGTVSNHMEPHLSLEAGVFCYFNTLYQGI